MTRVLWLLLLLGLSCRGWAAGIVQSSSATYRLYEQASTALDVPANQRTISWDRLFTLYPNDDDQVALPIGFNFQFGSGTYSSVKVLTNGLLQFTALDLMYLDYTNNSLPASSGDRFLAAYWDDLVDDDQATVKWGTMGTAPERRFVVTWHNVRAYANNLRYDFQVVLYENGDIRLRYNNNEANGASATIGLQLSSNDYLQYSYNQSSVSTSFDLLFRNRSLMLPTPVAWYSLDADSYSGLAGEVKDISANGLHGIAKNSTSTSSSRSALSGTIGTCRYGVFDGVDDYIEIADNSLLDMSSTLTVGAWVRFDALSTGDIRTVVSKDENYEFHIDQQGRVYWWWNDPYGNVRTLTSSTALMAGSWNHIAVSYRSGYQVIYVNGKVAAQSYQTGSLMLNSDPLQIGGDQGMSGRYFNGSVDEVQIFSQALSQNQVLEMMRKTRPCPAFNLCLSSFPDGVASYSNGTISFADSSQLFFSPTDVLYAGSVSQATSTPASCVTVACSAGAGLAPQPPEQAFQTTTKGSNVTIQSGRSTTLGSTSTYQRISMADNATAVFAGSQPSYLIDSLVTGTGAVLQLEPATYWIRSLTLGASNRITVSGSGTARIFVQDAPMLGNGLLANSPGSAQTGSVSALLLYAYNGFSLGSGSTWSGVIFSRGNFVLGASSSLFGAATAANLSIGVGSKVYYDPVAVADAQFGSICSSSSSCVLGGFLVEQPLYGLACPDSRMAFSVQALCADGVSVKTDYAGTLLLSSSENSASVFYPDSTATSSRSVVLDGSEGGALTLYAEHQNEQHSLLLTVTDQDTGLAGSGHSTTDVRSSGFRVVTEPQSMVCGGSTNMALVAVGQNETATACQQLTNFNGSKSLKAWFAASLTVAPDPVTVSTVSTPLVVNGTAISAQQQPVSDNLTLTFSNGRADMSLTYANAAQLTGFNLLYNPTPHEGSSGSDAAQAGIGPLQASSASWVVRPQQVALQLASGAVCSSLDNQCAPLVRAGDPLALTAQALCSDGSIATDFRGTVNLVSQAQLPAGGNNPAPVPASFDMVASDSGQHLQNIALNDVGIFSLASSAVYQGATLDTAILEGVGRVVPHHFRVLAPVLTQDCGTFTYMGQPGLQAGFHLQAENATNGLVLNYRDGLARASLQWLAENSNDGVDRSARVSGSRALVWSNGEADVQTLLQFNRDIAPDGPLSTLSVGVALADNDGGWSPLTALDMHPASSGDCSVGGLCSGVVVGDANLLFGRLQLENASGPEVEDLRQDMALMYSQDGRWLPNTADQCSKPSLGNLVVDATSAEGTLTAADTAPTLIGNVDNGSSYVIHSAPGLDNTGSLLYRYQAPDWLRTEENGDGDYQDYPSGRVIFGAYRGTDRVIYWREQMR